MTNPLIRIPAPVFERIKEHAEDNYMSMSGLVARVMRDYLDAQKPKGPTIDPALAHLSPQARAARTKEEIKKEQEAAARRAKHATYPEFFDGCEVYRYGITEDWSPSNPGYGYVAMPAMLTDGETVVTLRVTEEDYAEANTVVIPAYVPERPTVELPEDWDDD